ncbi:DegT/DnrJ/EryC1/StrS family aminotransferase [Georgenia deserti]|uniref:DegT/DnrJ/EryC1/StrS family aminotransferase n=1 Tax=Georgenia deserti TaxID=2093781 RepID=A0ABW4L894_9MICO
MTAVDSSAATAPSLPAVPFLDLSAQSIEIADEVLPVWREQLLTAAFVGGVEVDGFENEYAAYIGATHCVGVSNGTDALELAYRAVGVGPGDEVIMPGNTFIATAEAASRIGAVPVFVDVDDDQLLIDVDAVAAAITTRTRAIVPVHLYGQTAPVEQLRPLAAKHGIAIVEDAAQAQGASAPAGRAGALGDIAATSFYPGKNLGAAGDAGAVTTDDPGLAASVRMLQAHGSVVKYEHERVGVNARLDALQATVLRAKLRRLEAWNGARRSAAATYRELLAGTDGVRLPASRPDHDDVWHLYVVRVEQRDQVVRALGRAGIGTGIHYPTPVHLTAAYAHLGYRRGQLPVVEAAAARVLSLPMYPHLERGHQVAVADAVRTAVHAAGSRT